MIDWIKGTVGLDLVLLNLGYIVLLISILVKEFVQPDLYDRNKSEYKNHYKRRGWVLIAINFGFLLWLALLPMTVGVYRHAVVFYARLNYSESQELCNELKEYGYVCQENKSNEKNQILKK